MAQPEGDERQGSLGGNLLAALAAAGIIGLGIWLVVEMDRAAKYEKCVAARHKNCDGVQYRP
jgi:hypothetical protein